MKTATVSILPFRKMSRSGSSSLPAPLMRLYISPQRLLWSLSNRHAKPQELSQPRDVYDLECIDKILMRDQRGKTITPRKFNIDLENRPSQKETHLPIFQPSFFRGYVKLRGSKQPRQASKWASLLPTLRFCVSWSLQQPSMPRNARKGSWTALALPFYAGLRVFARWFEPCHWGGSLQNKLWKVPVEFHVPAPQNTNPC